MRGFIGSFPDMPGRIAESATMFRTSRNSLEIQDPDFERRALYCSDA
jgi:hypothetical protein